jgi:hypothetical protein
LTVHDDGYALRFQGQTLVVPGAYAGWLMQLESGRALTVRELLALDAAQSTRDDTFKAVRQLITEGCLIHAHGISEGLRQPVETRNLTEASR